MHNVYKQYIKIYSDLQCVLYFLTPEQHKKNVVIVHRNKNNLQLLYLGSASSLLLHKFQEKNQLSYQ